MKRAAAAALLIFLLLPSATRAEEESLEAIEKDLSSVIKEMDAMSSELDRIQEITAAPKATALRVEIHRGADLPAPVTGRLLVGGKVEEAREWSRAEREAFSVASPLVFQVPFLPGTYSARFEIAHPGWKAAPSADFPADLRKGETFLRKLRLSLSPGTAVPVLVPMAEK
jgi:hypothetical protein